MEFDPNLSEKFPYLSGNYPENLTVKSEIPTEISLNPICSNPSQLNNNTTNKPFMYQNNNFFDFLNEGSSSIIPTDFSGNAYYSMEFSQNTIVDTMHGYLNSGETIWDFSQPRMSPSLSPLLGYEPFESNPVQPKLRDEVLQVARVGDNNAQPDHTSLVTAVVDERKPEKNLLRKNKKTHQHKVIHIIKGQWTADEDKVLVQMVKRFGTKKWSQIARLFYGRVGKQCRERWHNHLRPNIRKECWDEEEDKVLIESHKEIGNKWAEIAKRLPGRTENTIKNRWNATKRRLNSKSQKSRQNNTSSNGSKLLQNYIKEVTVAEEADKEIKKSMANNLNMDSTNSNNNAGVHRVRYESSDGEFSSDDMEDTTEESEAAGYTIVDPRHVANGGYVMEESTMDYQVEMEPEISMQKEMELMKLINRNP